MKRLKMNQRYIMIYEIFGFKNDCGVIFYTCDYKDKFEMEERDWNCDGDVYKLEGQYLANDEGSRRFITKDTFEEDFYEYNPTELKDGYIIDTKGYTAYTKIQKIKHEGIEFVYLENPFHHLLITDERYNKEFVTVDKRGE